MYLIAPRDGVSEEFLYQMEIKELFLTVLKTSTVVHEGRVVDKAQLKVRVTYKRRRKSLRPPSRNGLVQFNICGCRKSSISPWIHHGFEWYCHQKLKNWTYYQPGKVWYEDNAEFGGRHTTRSRTVLVTSKMAESVRSIMSIKTLNLSNWGSK